MKPHKYKLFPSFIRERTVITVLLSITIISTFFLVFKKYLYLFIITPLFHFSPTYKDLGLVEQLDNFVLRKFADDTIWLPITRSQPIYDGDSIITSENSEVTFQLNNGMKVFVQSDSFVRIYSRYDTFEININYGEIDVSNTQGKEFYVRSRGSAVEKMSSVEPLKIKNQKDTTPNKDLAQLSSKVDELSSIKPALRVLLIFVGVWTLIYLLLQFLRDSKRRKIERAMKESWTDY